MPAQTGAFQIKFTQRSPLSDYSLFVQRFNVTRDQLGPDYKIEDHPFALYIPPDYDPSKALGILVYEVPDGTPQIDPLLHPVLDRHRLIMVGINADHPVLGMGAGLCLDAVFNLQQRYEVDSSRIYLIGCGLWTEPIGWCTGDVCTGDTYISYIGWYRPILKNPPVFNITPPEKMLRFAKTRPQVLSFDPDPTQDWFHKAAAAAMINSGFEHVFINQFGGLSPEWFDQVLKLMESVHAPAHGIAATQPAPDQPQRLLNLAQAYINSSRSDLARTKLDQVIEKYPTTDAARKARELLDQINAQ